MTTTEATEVTATEPNAEGYKQFSLGGFTFRRDEFFAHITWPTGSHVLSVDNFLRALQRDVAWDFFYGTVNFDGVFGTVNHYGTVDMFAGRYNDAYRKAELDHVENFETPLIRETFKAMLDDWTNDGFDPFASPAETAKPFGVKHGSNTPAVTRHRVTAERMVGVPGRRADPDRRHPPDQPHVRRRAAGRARDPRRAGLRGRGRRVQPVRLPQPVRRHVEPVGGQPVQGQPLLPDDGGVHPPRDPRQRPGRVVHPALRRDPLGGGGPRHGQAPGQGRHEGR